VDCQFDLQREAQGQIDYRARHIPGADYASVAHDMAGPKTGTNGRHPLPSLEAFGETARRLGISPGRQVVVYDQDSGLFASRLWWMLRASGHDAVALLDGGLAKWMQEGRPTRTGDESSPPGTFTPRPYPERLVQVDEIAAGLDSPGRLLVDARGPERFEGQQETIDRAAGHIPGAVNHFYRWNLAEDGTMLPPERLREVYAGLLGTRRASDVVMYCGSGVSACHNLLAMEQAGLTGSKLFVGSWSEWSSDPARPIATGPAGATPPGAPSR
jgi:thiosulfate/3-mercaptopyruvate sulfurtransferase